MPHSRWYSNVGGVFYNKLFPHGEIEVLRSLFVMPENESGTERNYRGAGVQETALL